MRFPRERILHNICKLKTAQRSRNVLGTEIHSLYSTFFSRFRKSPRSLFASIFSPSSPALHFPLHIYIGCTLNRFKCIFYLKKKYLLVVFSSCLSPRLCMCTELCPKIYCVYALQSPADLKASRKLSRKKVSSHKKNTFCSVSGRSPTVALSPRSRCVWRQLL